MSDKPYGLCCPITHAAEILEPRWTMPILCELWAGASRFNDIRRGVGSISPALLSRRLKEMEELGLVERIEDKASGTVDYIRTQAAIDLEPALNALAMWAQANIEARQALDDVNVSTLMWKMRTMIDVAELPPRQVVIQFRFSDPGLEYDTYWVLARPGRPLEICTDIPGFDVDLFVETSKVSLVSIILERTSLEREIDTDRTFLSGDALLARTLPRWLKRTEYTPEGTRMLEGAPVQDAGAA